RVHPAGLSTAHQAVADADMGLSVNNNNPGTVPRTIFGNIAQVQHTQVTEPLLELADASVHETLSLLGVLILGVLRKVTMSPRDSNLFRQLHIELVLQLIDFFLQLLLNPRDRVGHAASPEGFTFSGFV